MTVELKFYKEDGRWYADVPNHTQEENEMVFGADDFLEMLSQRLHKSEIYITLSDEKIQKPLIVLYQHQHDEFGAEYHTSSSYEQFHNHNVWICNVTHDVFGDHPEVIYIFEVR